ncbi:MAG: site-specific integrase [Quadrisphaera sp.]
MSSIRPRRRNDGSTYYSVLFRDEGKQRSRSFERHDAARRYQRLVDSIGPKAADEMVDIPREADLPPTLAEWLEHHLKHATGITEGTRADYQRLAERSWLPTLGAVPVDAVSRDAVAAWVGRQAKALTNRGTPTSAKTISNAHTLLSTVMASAVQAGHRADNPCRGVRLPRTERDEMVFLSHAEFAHLVAAVPEFWRPLVATLAGTGVRWGEATALQWGDVDLEADVPVLRVARAWKRGGPGGRTLGAPKTRRALRSVSLPPEVADALRPHAGDSEALVFTGKNGNRVDHRYFHRAVWKPAVAALAGDRVEPTTGEVTPGRGKRPRIHDLRHSHASWLLGAGVSLHVVQRRLGHESITTTVDVYGHLADSALAHAAAASSAALTAAFPSMEPVTAAALPAS